MYQVINFSPMFHMTSQNCFHNQCQSDPGTQRPRPHLSKRRHLPVVRYTQKWNHVMHQLKQQPVYLQICSPAVRTGTTSGKDTNRTGVNFNQKPSAEQLWWQAKEQSVLLPRLLQSKAAPAFSNNDEHKPLLHTQTNCTSSMDFNAIIYSLAGQMLRLDGDNNVE